MSVDNGFRRLEISSAQNRKIIRDKFLVDAKAFNKIMGIPFTKHELVDEIKKMLL